MNKQIAAQFQADVLNAQPDSALPCNLSDQWLRSLSAQSMKLTAGGPLPAELGAAVLHVVRAKFGSDKVEVEIPYEDFKRYVEDYCLELALEEVSRESPFKAEPATLETIFTERDVDFALREG